MALDGFAVGGDVELSEQQKRNGATGDAMLEVFDWPSKHLLGVYHSWTFSSVFYGAVLYGAVVGLNKCFRKTKTKGCVRAWRLLRNNTHITL